MTDTYIRIRKREPFPLIFVAAGMALMLVGCATVYNPATGRKEAVFINTAQEKSIGDEVEEEILRRYRLSLDPAKNERTRRVGRDLSAACSRTDVDCEFSVVESEDINAFALPGGSVFVTTALLDAVESDDELVSVVGHEVGHICARHPVKRLESQLGYSFLVDLAYALDTRPPAEKNRMWEDITMATDITFNIIALGYSRNDEILADRLGAIYAEKAGYDPEGAIRFLKKLEKEEAAGPGWLVFTRSHPYIRDRIKALEEWTAEKKALGMP